MAKLSAGIIFGLGNPLLDITAHVDVSFLEKWNLPVNSAILADPEKHKGLYDDMVKLYGKDIEYSPGGATQNSMRVTQWVLNTPLICTFTGCVGSDKFGDLMAKRAAESGVNALYMINNDEKTGTCAVCVTDGGTNRSLCAYLGAANTFKKTHLDHIWSSVEEARIYYVSGFHLTVSPESILALAEHANKEPNKLFCFNLSAPFISEFFSTQLLSVLPYVNYLFGNETEAQAFAKLKKWSDKLTVREIAVEIAKLERINPNKERIVVITQGADNIIIVKGNGTDVKEFPATKLEKSKVIDTNGAGDAFVGGFLAQLALGKEIETCVKCGTYAATEVIQLSGCTFPDKCTFNA